MFRLQNAIGLEFAAGERVKEGEAVADETQIKLLKEKGVEAWNEWRKEHPRRRVNFSQANLFEADLGKANLEQALLRGANLNGANLSGATLIEADLCQADLRRADFREANLTGADLRWARIGRCRKCATTHHRAVSRR